MESIIGLVCMLIFTISCVMVAIGSANNEESFGDKFNVRVGLILFLGVIIATCVLKFIY